MNKKIIDIFEPNRDADATSEGFYYQNILTVKYWLQAFLDNSNLNFYCDYEDDLKTVSPNEKTISFYQFKCYKERISFSNEVVTKSLYNFCLLLDKYHRSFRVSCIFQTNQSVSAKAKLISRWLQGNDLSELDKKELILIIEKKLISYIKEKAKKVTQKKNVDKKELESALGQYTQIIKSNSLNLVNNIHWSFSQCRKFESIKELEQTIQELILKLDVPVPSLLFTRLFFEVIAKSKESLEQNTLLNQEILENVLLESETEIKSKISEHQSKCSVQHLEFFNSRFEIIEKNIEQLQKIQREHHNQLNSHTTRIKKLEDSQIYLYWKALNKDSLSDEQINILRHDYFSGVQARYEHILANVDILRNDKLNHLNSLVKTNHVVILHGASGQGKSSLAYRFIHSLQIPCFELTTIDSLFNVNEAIESLKELLKNIKSPIIVYIDIQRANDKWIYLIQETYSLQNLKILVTIREEDWNQATAVGSKFIFKEMRLEFEKTEAKSLYESLVMQQSKPTFLTFDEAWETFGGKGPLLEFVYLIVQGQTLIERLREQVNNLRNDNSRSLLQLIAIADSFRARIDLTKLAQDSTFDSQSTLSAIKELQGEYFIRQIDNRYLVGLHPIRSQLLLEVLFDDIFFPFRPAFEKALNMIDEYDLYWFLLHAFVKETIDNQHLIEYLQSTYQLRTWVGYLGVFKALLWWGVYNFVDENTPLFEEVYDKCRNSWYAFINIDCTGIMQGQSLMEKLKTDKESWQYATQANQRLSSKDHIYDFCRDWLKTLSFLETQPITQEDWLTWGEFLFWVSHIKSNQRSLNLSNFNFKQAFESLSLETLAIILLGLKSYSRETVQIALGWEQSYLEQFRKKFSIFTLEVNETKVKAHFIINESHLEREGIKSNFIHNRTLEILEYLRVSFPNKEYYCTQGYGHKNSLVDDRFDPTHKEFSAIKHPFNQLLEELNGKIINLVDYHFRPNTWDDYVKQVIQQRYHIVTLLEKILVYLKKFKKYHNDNFSANKLVEIEDYRLSFSSGMPKLPRIIIDQWGINSDSNVEGESNQAKRASSFKNIQPNIFRLTLDRYQNYLKSVDNYETHITNFVRTSILTCAGFIGAKPFDGAFNSRRHVSKLNIFDVYYTIDDFQYEFRKLFTSYVPDELYLNKLEEKEKSVIAESLNLWFYYVNKRSQELSV